MREFLLGAASNFCYHLFVTSILMRVQTFHRIVGIIFLIVALVHLLRVLQGWVLVIGELTIPDWMSLVAVIVLGYLSFQAFRIGKK